MKEQQNPNIVVGSNKRSLFRFRKHKRIIGGVVLVLGVVALVALVVFLVKDYRESSAKKTAAKINQEATTANKYVLQNDKSQALVHAKAALALAPDDPETILTVASLSEKDNPSYAKQLYAHALDVLQKQDATNKNGKKAITYWAEAGLAEKAGLTAQAKQYYQKVIDTANPVDKYEHVLAIQAQAALKRLQ